MALLRQLLSAVQLVRLDRILSPWDQVHLNDAIAIVSFESGAERRAGPIASVPLLRARLELLLRQPHGYCFGCGTIAQLATTLVLLRTHAA
jgi:hypothetical protein